MQISSDTIQIGYMVSLKCLPVLQANPSHKISLCCNWNYTWAFLFVTEACSCVAVLFIINFKNMASIPFLSFKNWIWWFITTIGKWKLERKEKLEFYNL